MDSTTKLVYDVYKKSGSVDALPSAVERTFTVAGKPITLTNDEYLEYTALVGQERKAMIDTYTSKPEWNEMSPELQSKVLKTLYGNGQKSAKNQIYAKYYSVLSQ